MPGYQDRSTHEYLNEHLTSGCIFLTHFYLFFYTQFLIDAKITSHEGTAIIDEVTPLLSSSNNRELSPKLFLKARMDPVPFVKVNNTKINNQVNK